jgi:PKD repeat protein
VGIASRTWDFGDGATATGCCPTHRYPADGTYTVQLTVATNDDRTDHASQVVAVVTHEVAITKFTVPTSSAAGQTRSITIGISNARYPETVSVQLFKSVSSGFELVGTLTQFVPVRVANRTTPFSFSYTFTKADATMGKVTFKTEAVIQGYRDALPSDNTATALPTKVTK